MTPDEMLREMCRRHGLPPDYAVRLIPLVRRAMDSPEEVRRKILAMVDGNLAQHAADLEERSEAEHDPEEGVLVAVARLMHHWTPSETVLDLPAGFGEIDITGLENP